MATIVLYVNRWEDTLVSYFKQTGIPALIPIVSECWQTWSNRAAGVLQGTWAGRCLSDSTSGVPGERLSGMSINAQNSKQSGMFSFLRRIRKLFRRNSIFSTTFSELPVQYNLHNFPLMAWKWDLMSSFKSLLFQMLVKYGIEWG